MSKSLYKFTDGFGEIENSKDVALARNLFAVCEKQQEYYDYCYSLQFYTDICNILKETMKEYGSEKNKQTTDGLNVYDYDLKVFLEESINNILEMVFEKSRKLDQERQRLQPEYPGSSTIFAQAVFDAADTVSQMFARFAELNDSLNVSRAICKSEHDSSSLLRVIENHYSEDRIYSYNFGKKTMEYSKMYKLLTLGRSNYYSHLPLSNHAFFIGIAENLKSRGYQFNPEVHGKHFSLGKNTFISPLIFTECKRSDLARGVSTLEHGDRFRSYAPLVRARFKDDDYGLKAKIVFNNKNSSDFMNLEAEEFFCMIGSQNKYVQKAMNDAFKKHYASYDSCYRAEEYIKDIQLTVKLNRNDKLLKDMILSSSEKNCNFKNVVYRLMVAPLFMSKDIGQVVVETDTSIVLNPKIVKNILDCQDKLVHNILEELDEKITSIKSLASSQQDFDEVSPTL